MPLWFIPPNEYLSRLGLSLNEFVRELRLPDVSNVTQIVPLRMIRRVTSPPIPISQDLLVRLLRRVRTMDNQLPFLGASFLTLKIDPRHLKVGQRFIYRENYLRLMENIPDLFHQFPSGNGYLSDLGAYFIFGETETKEYALACYIPPLIEQHGEHLAIMDGVHRDFIVKQAGSTINAVLIRGVEIAFPCSMHGWEDTKVIPLSEKPEQMADRYFDLRPELFRNLKYLGIDG